MALITCQECGNKVSDQAESCPECGCPVEKKILEIKITCFECGESFIQSQKTCPKCGAPNKKPTQFDLSPNDEKVRESIKKTANFVKKYPKKNKVVIPGIVIVGLIYLIIGIFSQNNSNNTPNQIRSLTSPPSTITPPTSNSSDVLGDTCRLCRLTGDCSAFPFCTKSQRTCEWKRTWDGKLVQECRSF